jgi:hypothetical protein
MIKWKKEIREAEDSGDERPPVSRIYWKLFLKIAERLCSKSNFMNYPYKDEMIGDGIENCLMYAHNFNPRKSKNPFSYFTQIIYYAFLTTNRTRKKQAYIKFKLTENMDDGTLHKWFKENYFDKSNEREALTEHFSISERDIEKYEPKKRKKRRQEIMKIAVISDTHFGARGDSPLFLNHFLKFFEDQFFPYLKEHGITKVLHLGDLFDRRKFINFNTLHHTKKRFIEWFDKNGVELHCILGNHDVFYKNTNRLNSPKEVLGGCHPSFHLYEDVTEVCFNGASILTSTVDQRRKSKTIYAKDC